DTLFPRDLEYVKASSYLGIAGCPSGSGGCREGCPVDRIHVAQRRMWMNTVFDFAPLWRSGIGFDHLFDILGQAAKTEHSDNYPPYDIEKTGEDAYRLTLALAGWTPDEITVISEPSVLVVSGQKAEPENKQYLH